VDEKNKSEDLTSVDSSLVAMFLKMTPEERIRMSASSARTILELRNGFKRREADERRD
jgi:hypothetical protein